MDANAKPPGGGGRLNADTCDKGGSKVGKIVRTYFMDGAWTKHFDNSTGKPCRGDKLPGIKNGEYDSENGEYNPKTKITVKCDPG